MESGALPELFVLPNNETKRNYIAAIKDTVSNYIGYIEDTFLIHKAERYDIRGKDTISGNCKYYINDLSFKNYLYPGFAYGTGYNEQTIRREYASLEAIPDNYEKYVVSLDDISFPLNQGIKHIQAWKLVNEIY